MPLYEYECNECGQRTEVLQRLSDAPLEKCPECGGVVRKLLSAPAFQFKGSGWYVTDYARKGDGGGKAEGGKGEGGKAEGGKDEGAKGATSGEKSGGESSAKAETTSKPASGSPSD